MKSVPFLLVNAALASVCFGQANKPAAPSVAVVTTPAAPSFLPPHELKLLCVHEHELGQPPTTYLYRVKEVKSQELHGRIHVHRLTAIVIDFTNVNTFCFTYAAGVTKQTSFYNTSAPAVLKPFIQGGLPTSIFSARAGDPTSNAQSVFSEHYSSYKPLGLLANKIAVDYAACISPEKKNSEIRTAILSKLTADLAFEDPKREVVKEDLVLRQSELQTGINLLTKDLDTLRAIPPRSGEALNADSYQGLIKQDEDALAFLIMETGNYESAISSFDSVKAAKDELEIPVLINAPADEFEITAAVTPITSKVSDSAMTVTPATLSSSIIVDITGDPVLDFGTGVVATAPANHSYYLNTKKLITDGGAHQPSYVPAAFVQYYVKPIPGQFSLAPTFGVDLSTGQNFFLGASLVRGGPIRLSLVGGLAYNKLTVLNGDKVGQALSSNAIQTKQQYYPGYFIGLTINFGG